MRLVGHVERIGGIRNAYNILVGKPEEKGIGVDKKIILKFIFITEIGGKGVDWIHLAQDTDQWRALGNTVMKLRVSQKVENFLTR
jgi:hypothetical protein